MNAKRYANKTINVYLRRLKKWSRHFTAANKNTPTELRLWGLLQKATRAADFAINVPGMFRALNQPYPRKD